MILEDILLDSYSGEFKLIDPNGKNHSKYYDIAKTLLSLANRYEIFYFDKFVLKFNNSTDISIIFTEPKLEEDYENMYQEFWQFLENNSSGFFGNDMVWRERLNLLNGIQNAAIVMFHFIQHNKEDRAIAFLLMSIKKLTEFLNNDDE